MITSKRISERIDRSKDTGRNVKVTDYLVAFAFSTDLGRNIENETSTPKEIWERIQEKDTVKI